ncbi:MAG: VOC family protein [Desulfobacteraceae bacterium]|nr:MAG: VOC family protein [Desulfobacteraceae bacterium]
MAKYSGVNHLAMVTADMDETIRYWRDLLGMPLVASLGRKGFRHYFFELSDQDMIAFFEWPGVTRIDIKDHGVPQAGPLAFDHLSIGVESKEDLHELTLKLDAAGFWVSEIIDHGFILSIYTFDPNNIPLEFSWNVEGIHIRKHPLLLDKHPSPEALKGSWPQAGAWPDPGTGVKKARDFTIYPGEGKIFSDMPRPGTAEKGEE